MTTNKEWFDLAYSGQTAQEHVVQWIKEGNSIDI